MAKQLLTINDKYQFQRTDWVDEAYQKINSNFDEVYAALEGIGGGPVTAYWGQIGGLLSAQTDLSNALAGKEPAGAVAAHEALGDPHAQYLTTAEGQALFDALGTSSSSMATHLLDADPHPNYLTAGEGDARYATLAAPAAAVGAHEALPDPHPQYLVVSEGNALYQGLAANLTALAGLNSAAGLLEQTGAATFVRRALGVGATTSIPTRADADARYDAIGAAAAAQAASQAASAGLSSLAGLDATAGLVYQSGLDTFTKRTVGASLGTDILSRDAADTRYALIGQGGGGGNTYFPSGWI